MSTTSNIRRLLNEVQRIRDQENEYTKMFKLHMVNDDMYHWQAVLYGPEDSLYSGYQFDIDINLSDNYPYTAPSVKFKTPIQHVNINLKGDICLDILKDNWTASQNIRSIMMSLRLLLSKPNPDDPFNSDLANLYRSNINEYEKLIKEACAKFATVNK